LLTSFGQKETKAFGDKIPANGISLPNAFTTSSSRAFANGIAMVLAPNEFYKVDPIFLNRYYDLTIQGKYEVTFFRKTFTRGQAYDEPLSSNTLTFEVLEEFVTPEDLKDPGEFNWPPPEKPDETQAAQPPDAVKPVVE
jgi:hypothetical protein